MDVWIILSKSQRSSSQTDWNSYFKSLINHAHRRGAQIYSDVDSYYERFERYNMLQCRIISVVKKSAHIVNKHHGIDKWINIKSIYIPSSRKRK